MMLGRAASPMRPSHARSAPHPGGPHDVTRPRRSRLRAARRGRPAGGLLADATAPAAPAAAGAPRLVLAVGVDTTTKRTCSDSVAAGYGNECTGGICYERFEYDPETGTEYVVTCDPETPRDTALTMESSK